MLQGMVNCNTLRIGPMQVSAKPAKTRIETIRRCPPGTCVRVENEVITLHNSPRWDPQNGYIYNTTPGVKNTDIQDKDPNHLEIDIASSYGQDANGAKSPEE